MWNFFQFDCYYMLQDNSWAASRVFADFDSKDFMGVSTTKTYSSYLKVKINRKNELIVYSLYKPVVIIKIEWQSSVVEKVPFVSIKIIFISFWMYIFKCLWLSNHIILIAQYNGLMV